MNKGCQQSATAVNPLRSQPFSPEQNCPLAEIYLRLTGDVNIRHGG